MPLVSRSPRPLQRNVGGFRDDRLFIIACDDTYAPKQYFSFFRLPRIQVHVVATSDGTSAARHVVDRLKEVEHEPDDERWVLLDTDHCIQPNHIGSFTLALKEAEEAGMNVALSRPCFELWLLLHHVEPGDLGDPKVAADVEEMLGSVLGRYDKTKLDESQFSLESVAVAVRRGEELDGKTMGAVIPDSATSRVYKLWQSIVSKALSTQLPAELSGLACKSDA